MIENALYIRLNENTKEVILCLNSSMDEILETDILYIQNVAPCYTMSVIDSQGYPLYVYEDSQLIPVTEDQRFKFHIEDYKLEKLSQIDRDFTSAIESGKLMSVVLGIEIDCRRGGRNNDKQNVEGMINLMETYGRETDTYIGVSQTVGGVTINMLKQVILEMETYGYNLYQKKFLLQDRVEAAQTLEELNSISW